MDDLVLDTSIISEFLNQYFDHSLAARGSGEFAARGRLSGPIAAELNRIIHRFWRYDHGFADDDPHSGGIVVASAFAFIELARSWDKMVGTSFSIVQVEAFLRQPPDWFDLAPVDHSLLPFYIDVPGTVFVNHEEVGIEWCDAIHVATALSRGPTCLLATSDTRIAAIDFLKGRVLQ